MLWICLLITQITHSFWRCSVVIVTCISGSEVVNDFKWNIRVVILTYLFFTPCALVICFTKHLVTAKRGAHQMELSVLVKDPTLIFFFLGHANSYQLQQLTRLSQCLFYVNGSQYACSFCGLMASWRRCPSRPVSRTITVLTDSAACIVNQNHVIF